ncbi:MAG: ABC transporter permease [Blastocatellia bacterium]
MESLLQDLRYGFRMLTKRPWYTVVAVIALALGIGANTAIFSLVDALLFRPLHFKDVDRLVMIWSGTAQTLARENISPADFVDWKNQNNVFDELAAISWWDVNLTGNGEPERIQAFQVSPSFFAALDEKPLLGRVLLPDEEQPGRDQVAVLNYSLWQRQFAGDPNIVGQTIRLNGKSHTVVGVMARGFEWPMTAEVWTPLAMTNEQMSARKSRYLMVMGRIKEGLNLPEAQAEMDIIARRLAKIYPDTNQEVGVMLKRVPGDGSEDFSRPFLLSLLGAVAFVLLIACANVANLQLARATGRVKEIAIRSALGASRFRVVRQLLTESIMLALLGAGLGLLLAVWGIDFMRASFPPDLAKYITGLSHMGLDVRALGFTLAIALLTGIISGLAPAIQTSRPNLNETLKEGGRSSASGSHRHRLRSVLVIAEIALALVLMVGTGLMVKGFARLLDNQRKGFDSRNLLTMSIALPDAKYKEAHQRVAFHNQLLERLKAMPEIESVGSASSLPSSGNWNTITVNIEGRPAPTPDKEPLVDYQSINDDYFRAMRIPMMKGREFGSQDGKDGSPVTIVSQSFANRFFPDEDAIGKRIKVVDNTSDNQWITIVGVAGDVKHFMFDSGPRSTLYLPYAQLPRFRMSLALRSFSDPMSIISSVRAQVRAIDSDQPIYEIKTMEKLIIEHVSGIEMSATLMAIFGVMALILSAVGVYSVMAYAVSQRTHEIGVRMALGATQKDILRLVVGQASRMAAIGLGIGLPMAFALTRVVASAFFGVVALDAITFMSITLLLAAVALLSGYIPARRAAKVDPCVALRYE